MSGVEPAANGTTSFTGLVGQSFSRLLRARADASASSACSNEQADADAHAKAFPQVAPLWRLS